MFGFIGVTVIAAALFPVSFCFAANPFKMGKVEYFFDEKDIFGQRQEEAQMAMDWREPVSSADGKMIYYTPPEQILRLLNDPSPENAQGYMDWQKEKIERIVKAQEAVVRLQHEGHE